MSNHSIIEHRANYYFLKLEEDYVEICQGKHKHCKAAILSILENWMNSKRVTASRESDLYVYLSYPQFVKQMFGLYGRNTVIVSLEELEQEGLILKRPFRDVFNQDTFEYRLNCSVVQQKLSMLPDKPATWGSLNLNGGSLEMDGGSFENKRGGSLLLNGGSFKSKRNIEPTIEPIIEPTENTEREEVAIATARSQSSLSQNNLSEDDEDTVEREAVKPSQKDTTHGTSAHSASSSTAMGNASTPGSNRPERQDTNKVTHPPAPKKPPANTIPKRPKQQGMMDEIPPVPPSKPVEPLAEMAWGTRKCLQWFDYWRGGTLIAKYKLIQASTYAKGLVEQFDEATVIEIYGDMSNDPYYIQRGGPDISDVVNNIHKYLNKKRLKGSDKDESNEHRVSSFGTPGYNFADEFYPSEAEKKRYRAAQAQAQEVKA